MNFAAFTFLENAQPRGLLAWYMAFIMVLALTISPVRDAGHLHTALNGVIQPRCSGEFRALATAVQRPCADVASALFSPFSAPREGQFFRAASRHQETLRNTHHSAPRSAAGAEKLLPLSGSFGVTAAGAVRGSGAGIISNEERRLWSVGRAKDHA